MPEAVMKKAKTLVSGDNSVDVIQSHHFSGPKSPSDHHFGMSKSFHVRGTGPRKTEKTVLSLTKLLVSDKSMRKRQDKLKQPQSIKDKQLSLDQNNSGSYIFGSYAASKTLQPTDSSKSQHEISPIADDMDEAQNGDFQILSVE